METALIKVDIEIPWLFKFLKKRFLLHEELSWINGKFGTFFTYYRDGRAKNEFGPTIPRHKSFVRWQYWHSWEWPLFWASKWYLFAFEYFSTRYKLKPVVPSFSWRFPDPFPKNFLNNSFQRIPSTVITYVCRLLPFIFWPVHFQTSIWMSCKSTFSSSEIQNVNSGDDFSNRNSHFFSKIRSFEPSCQSLVLEVAVR